MMGKKIFVSYRADDEGSRYKNLLTAWSKNDNNYFDLKYEDVSVGTSIKSENADYIKSVIKSKIKDSSVFLCLIGKNTSSSDWVNWEIRKAVELNKKIVAVKIDVSYPNPIEIYGVGASWAKCFKYDSIKKAIDG